MLATKQNFKHKIFFSAEYFLLIQKQLINRIFFRRGKNIIFILPLYFFTVDTA